MQQWYGLSDPPMEGSLHDIESTPVCAEPVIWLERTITNPRRNATDYEGGSWN